MTMLNPGVDQLGVVEGGHLVVELTWIIVAVTHPTLGSPGCSSMKHVTSVSLAEDHAPPAGGQQEVEVGYLHLQCLLIILILVINNVRINQVFV